jgi:hypothetical protein
MPKIALDADRRVYPAKSPDHQYQANVNKLAFCANEKWKRTGFRPTH